MHCNGGEEYINLRLAKSKTIDTLMNIASPHHKPICNLFKIEFKVFILALFHFVVEFRLKGSFVDIDKF